MGDFVDFAGVAEQRGDTVRLVSLGNNGALQFASQDVKLENNRVAVRVGAVAIAIRPPIRFAKVAKVASRAASDPFTSVATISGCSGLV
jgi:hypothetical protein